MNQIKNEIIDILNMSKNNSIHDILDKYDSYNKKTIVLIQTRTIDWFITLFEMIQDLYDSNMLPDKIKKLLLFNPDIDKNILNHILDSYQPMEQKEHVKPIEQKEQVKPIEQKEQVEPMNDEKILDNKEIEEILNDSSDELEEIELLENKEDKSINLLDDVDIEDIYNNSSLRNNQINAIRKTIEQGYISGIHNQIMGAGKTFILLSLINEHLRLYPNNGIYIITCYRKEILIDMISMLNSKKDFFKNKNIIDIDKFNLVDQVCERKKSTSASTNIKPTLLIINTDYLKTFKMKYTKINFIILDECHSISASNFYNFIKRIKDDYNKHIIGFSATPMRDRAEQKTINVFSNGINNLNIISNYDLFSAIKDNIILPPYYVIYDNDDYNNMDQVLKETLKKAPYRKIIGWCRNIKSMKKYYKHFKNNFPNLTVYCSSFNDKEFLRKGYNTSYQNFYNATSDCIMVCCNRYREGSDIPNLDIVIYLDKVKKRSLLVSMQTSGRVLRKDDQMMKNRGYIIDLVKDGRDNIGCTIARKIIKYYENILSLMRSSNNYMETYKKLNDICSNITVNEEMKEIDMKLDDNKNHNIKMKVNINGYDFASIKEDIKIIIENDNKMNQKNKFDYIVSVMKKSNKFNKNVKNFMTIYDEIKNDTIPKNSKLFYHEYKEFIDKNNWYDILGIDTGDWYNLSECKNVIAKFSIINQDKYNDYLNQDSRLPTNPIEYYKLQNINTYNDLLCTFYSSIL